jgi:hypothetical protein
MMKRSWIRFTLLSVTFLFLFSCAGPYTASLYKPTDYPPGTQLQIRELQERKYDTKDMYMVMKAVLNVLQDEGYTTKSIDKELGYVQASRENARLLKPGPFSTNAIDILDATVNVTPFGESTKVRISLHYKCVISFGHGYPDSEYSNFDLYEPTIYQDFFMKLDKALFIEGQKL